MFPTHLTRASSSSKTGLPGAAFLQHAMLTHWALSGQMERIWALAAAAADIEAFMLGGISGDQSSRPYLLKLSVAARVNRGLVWREDYTDIETAGATSMP